MRRLSRRERTEGPGRTSVADPPAEPGEDTTVELGELRAEIERLTEANRAAPDRATERRLVRLRHLAGVRLLDGDGARPEYPPPDPGRLPAAGTLPGVARDDVTPGLLRAGILRDGCLLVRGLVDRAAALRFAAQIDRAFSERERRLEGAATTPGFYEEFTPEAAFHDLDAMRPWIKEGGGVLALDSPLLAFELMELFRAAALAPLVEGYLGEPALISAQKSTLRKADPSVPGAWHQDGTFMGEVRALNLWLSLSRCGDEAPGLDIVPRRLEGLVTTQTDEAVLEIQVSQEKAEQAAGETPIIRPVFEPGDALFFDELFLHQTGSDPSMPKPRFAVENWFFGASAFPGDYAPSAV